MRLYLAFACLVASVLVTLLVDSFGLVGLVTGFVLSVGLGVMASDADEARRDRR